MLDQQIRIFIQVAECGSFSKAAASLFLSPSSVMRQMDQLESELEVKLFNRTFRGVSLSEAGEVLYSEVHFMDDYAKRVIEKVRLSEKEKNYIIRVATSTLYPCNLLLDRWAPIGPAHPEYRIHIISMDDSKEKMYQNMDALGKDFDFIVCPFDLKEAEKRCQFTQLGFCHLRCMMFAHHPLAQHVELTLDDLHGYKVLMSSPDKHRLSVKLYREIQENHPQIMLRTTDSFFDMSTFNQCAIDGTILITTNRSLATNQFMKAIPLLSGDPIPYGLLCTKNPADHVGRFLKLLQGHA